MTDRQPQYPGRVLITPEDGSTPYYATLTLADEPLVDGTPLNKANLLSEATAAAIAAASGTTPETPSEALALVLQNASYDPNNIVATASGAYNVQILTATNRTFFFPWSQSLEKMPNRVRLEIYPDYEAEIEAYDPKYGSGGYEQNAVIEMWHNNATGHFDGIVKCGFFRYLNSTQMSVNIDVIKGSVDSGHQATTGNVSNALFECNVSPAGDYITGKGGALFFYINSGSGSQHMYGYGFQFSQTGVSFTVAFRGPSADDSQYTRFSINAYAYK